jgi:hypothetical protein
MDLGRRQWFIDHDGNVDYTQVNSELQLVLKHRACLDLSINLGYYSA